MSVPQPASLILSNHRSVSGFEYHLHIERSKWQVSLNFSTKSLYDDYNVDPDGTSADPLSDAAMANLKQYKYQSVDKSFISNYILRHYVSTSRDTRQICLLY